MILTNKGLRFSNIKHIKGFVNNITADVADLRKKDEDKLIATPTETKNISKHNTSKEKTIMTKKRHYKRNKTNQFKKSVNKKNKTVKRKTKNIKKKSGPSKRRSVRLSNKRKKRDIFN